MRQSFSLAGVLALGVLAVGELATSAAAQDADGCFNAETRQCLDVSAEWSRHDHNRLNIRLQNHCNDGIYVRLCGMQATGREQCVAEWVSGNRSTNTYISNAESRGRYAWNYVGAARSTNSWLCASRVRGWHDAMF